MRHVIAVFIFGLAVAVWPGSMARAETGSSCVKGTPGSVIRPCGTRTTIAPAPQGAGSVWSVNAFSRNIWTEGRPGSIAPASQLRPASALRRRMAREPEAVDRRDAGGECLVIGDSIAVGVAQARPECNASARSGISSGTYSIELLKPARARTLVISLGVNDDVKVDTVANLRRVRSAVHGQTVFWLLPGIKERARAAIRKVAAEFGDRLIDTRPEAGRDHLHPTGAGYEQIAVLTRGGQRGRPAS